MLILGDRNCSIVREISKIYEEAIQGSISEVTEFFENHEPRGEIVLVIQGKVS